MSGDAMDGYATDEGTDPGTWTTVGHLRDMSPKVSLVRRRDADTPSSYLDGRLRDVLGPGHDPDSGTSRPWDGIRGPLHPRNRFTRDSMPEQIRNGALGTLYGDAVDWDWDPIANVRDARSYIRSRYGDTRPTDLADG